jgi:NAD(P)-dependent dehydrogenase (short-subunit alcohol dehydrogenase family)
MDYRRALIVGTGSGLSASLARLFAKSGMKVAVAARRAENLAALAEEIGGKAFTCDATDREQVAKLFADVEAAGGAPDVVVYNASYRTRGPFVDLDPVEVERALAVTAYGGFLVAQQAAKRMVPKGHGAIMLTRAIRSRRRSPWASSRCAGSRKAWRRSCSRKAFTSPILWSTAAS